MDPESIKEFTQTRDMRHTVASEFKKAHFMYVLYQSKVYFYPI